MNCLSGFDDAEEAQTTYHTHTFILFYKVSVQNSSSFDAFLLKIHIFFKAHLKATLSINMPFLGEWSNGGSS